MTTADTPFQLVISPDHSAIRADDRDLSFLTVRVTDKEGNTAPRAKKPIKFTIEGPGEIVATDNGDPTNLVAFPSRERAAFNGLCLAIVRGIPEQPGAITVRAEADSLGGASALLQSGAA